MSLQTQFPLSRRKFWKKMLSSTGGRGGVRFVSTLVYIVVFIGVTLRSLSTLFDANTGNAGQSLNTPIDPLHLVIAGTLGVVALIVVWFFIKALYVSAYIRHYVYDASEGFITIKKGVFTPQEIHVQWSKVQDVYVDQDLLDRMLGIYDVHLASATFSSAIEAHIDGVDKQVAGGLKMLLLDAVRRSGNTAQAPVATAAIQADTHPAFAGAVTSDQYPIDGRWVVQKFLSALGFSVVLIVLGFLVLSVAGSDMPDVIAPSTLLAVCVGGALIAFGGGFISNVIWRSNFRFELGEEYILRREGVVSRSEQHMPYRTIQDVIVSQGFFERLLGIARIDIMNAGGGLMVTSMTIPGQPVSKASELSALIRQIALSKNASQTGL